MMTPISPEFIHRYVEGPDPDEPTLLLLHGTGGTEDDLLVLGRELARRANLLSPRGKVLEHGMPRFFRRLAEGVFDLEDLRVRTDELAAFVEQSAATYRFDPRRVFAVGYSNGANIAGSMLFRQPGLLKGAVLFRPTVPFVPETLPPLTGVGVLVSAGQVDPIVPAAQTQALVELLRKSGAEVEDRWQRAGHGLIPEEIDQAREWLAGRLEATVS